MDSIFVDTSYWLALELANDRNHKYALEHWHRIKTSLPRLVTTSFIFDEVVTFFNSRSQHAKAVEIGSRLLQSPSLQFIYVDERLFFQGWDYFQRHKDKRYSLTDCISFVVMQDFSINTVFGFDHHFKQAGFQVEP